MKCPLRTGACLLGSDRVEILLVAVPVTKSDFRLSCCTFCPIDLLQGDSLADLIGLLLFLNQHDQSLIDPLQRRHFGMLRRVRGLRGADQSVDVGLALLGLARIVPSVCMLLDVTESSEIDRGSLCGDLLLAKRAQVAVSGDLACARNGRLLVTDAGAIPRC